MHPTGNDSIKEKQRAYQKAYYERTVEARQEYQRKWYARNREKVIAQNKAYNALHPRKKPPTVPKVTVLARQMRNRPERSYTPSDILHAPTEKSQKMIETILRGCAQMTSVR